MLSWTVFTWTEIAGIASIVLVVMSALLAVLGMLLMTGCVPVKPVPRPTPIPAVPVVTEATIYSDAGVGIPTATVTATPDNGIPIACPVDPSDARFHCELPPGTQHGDLDIAAAQYLAYHEHVEFPLGSDIVLHAARRDLSRIVARGLFFGTADGQRLMVREAVEFDLYDRFLAGQDITDVLAQLQRDGFNVARVFTAFSVCPDGNCPPSNQKIGRLVPSEHGDYYARISEFLDRCSQYGVHVEFVAWTGPYGGVLDGDGAKVAHYTQLCAAVQQRPNALISAINEADNGPNSGAPLDQIAPCPGVTSSHGSNSGDEDGVTPAWQYTELHAGAGASSQWQRRPGHDAMDLASKLRVSAAVTEVMRTDTETSANALQHYFDAGRTSALLNGWIVCHSPEGKAGVPWGLDSEAKCQALAAGALAIDLSCQDGAYFNNESAVGVIREYHRGPRPECVAPVRP